MSTILVDFTKKIVPYILSNKICTIDNSAQISFSGILSDPNSIKTIIVVSNKLTKPQIVSEIELHNYNQALSQYQSEVTYNIEKQIDALTNCCLKAILEELANKCPDWTMDYEAFKQTVIAKRKSI